MQKHGQISTDMRGQWYKAGCYDISTTYSLAYGGGQAQNTCMI